MLFLERLLSPANHQEVKDCCSSQFTLRRLVNNSHCASFNRVSTFRFPIQRFSIPQQYFCSHWLRNLFRVFACINTSKYVITRRSLPNQSMSLFVWCIPRLNSAGLLVRVCGSFRTLSLSMRLSGLVRKWTQKYKQKHSCIWSRYSFQQSHYFERFGRIQNSNSPWGTLKTGLFLRRVGCGVELVNWLDCLDVWMLRCIDMLGCMFGCVLGCLEHAWMFGCLEGCLEHLMISKIMASRIAGTGGNRKTIA